MNKSTAQRMDRDTSIEWCEKETGHAQKRNSHFCICTHVMYDSEKPGALPMHAAKSMTEDERKRRRSAEANTQEMTLQQYLEQLPECHLARREYHKLLKDVTAEIHMAEVQRDQAKQSAKNIVLDLIAEQSAEELKCWLNGPHQFKLAVIARLDNWR